MHDQPVRILEAVEERLAFCERIGLQGRQAFIYGEVDFATLQQLKFGLQEKIYADINPPWPGPDKPWGENGHWVWSPYSDEQVLVRTRAVYEGALKIYKHLVQTWFPTLSSRLNKYALFPARLVGIVTPPSSDPEHGDVGPIMDYYFEPLPDGEQTFVDIRLIGEHEERLRSKLSEPEFFQELFEQVKALRPEASSWLTFTTNGTLISDVFSQVRPATEIAYKWLWDDLKKITWVDGDLGRYSREEQVVFALPEAFE